MIGFRGRVLQDRRRAARLLCGASAAALLSLPSAAAGGDRYWDPNGTAIGRGGAGEWNLTSPLWSPSGDGVSGPYAGWSNGLFDNAIFGGPTGGTVTLRSQIDAGNLTFETPGYVLTGGILRLGGDQPTITTIGANTGVTIDAIVAGDQGLTKALAGVLRLNGVNTFSGDVFLNAGTLAVNADAALGAAANRVFTTGGSTLTATGALNSGRVVELGAGMTSLTGVGVGSARLTGSGGIVAYQGVTLNNDLNDFTGQATFRVNGTAYFTSVGNLGEASSLGAANTVAEGTIRFIAADQYSDWLRYVGQGDRSNRNWEFAYSGATSGAGFSNDGAGKLILTGDIHSIGSTTAAMAFAAQTADLELLGVLSSDGERTFTYRGGDAARMITLGGANTYAGKSDIGAGGGLTVEVSRLADTGQASSFGTGVAGGVTISNNSILQYVGAGSNSNRDWSIGHGGAGGRILNDGSGALLLSGAVEMAAIANNSLTLGGAYTGENHLSGVISGSGALASAGAGVWVLSGDNTRTGAIAVDGGVLRAGHASAFGTTTGATINAGTLDLNGYDLAVSTLSGSGGEIALGGAVLAVDGATNTSFAGNISGSGGLVKRGTSTLTLTGASTYSGDTLINGGAINLDFSGAGAPTTDIVSGATTLGLSGGTLNVFGGAGVTNSQSFNGVSIVAGSNRVKAVSGVAGDMTLNLGAISRTGGLIDFTLPETGFITTSNTSLGGWATVNGSDYAKVVGGVITAFDASDYTTKDNAATWLDGDYVTDDDGNADSFYGQVTGSVQLGGLRYTVADPTPNPNLITIGAGEMLGVDGTIIVAASVLANNQRISGGSLTGSFGGGVLGLQQNGGGTFTIASAITDNSGAVGFTKAGAGTARLSGANTYTGATTLSGGRLEITSVANGGEASSLGASSADSANLILESGVLAFVGGTDGVTDRGFTLVNGGAGVPTIEVASGRTLEFAGQVTSPDDAGLTKTGGGTLVLSNTANDYVGVTTVTGAGGAGGSSVLSVNTLADGGVASGLGAASSASANLVLAGGGRLQYTGSTVAIDRGFTLDTGSGRVDVAQAGTILTVSGAAVGAGGLLKEGDGVLVLSGANTYQGGTTVNGGTLRAGSQQAFGSLSSMTVNGGGRLELGGYDITVTGLLGSGVVDLGDRTLTSQAASANSFTGQITGTGNFIRTGTWTQVMTGCANDYTGTTTISGGGRLSIDCLADGGVASGIGASSQDAANLIFNNGTLAYTGADVTTNHGFTLAGTGALDVVDSNTTLEFAGAIVGSGGLRKEGQGTLVLSGANTYSGATHIRSGTLRMGSANALGGGNVTIDNAAGAILDLNGLDTGVRALNGGGALGGEVLLGGATMTFFAPGTGTADFGGRVTGPGALTKNGTFTQVLSGCESTYDGATTINGGVLATACLADGGVASSIGLSSADATNLIINGGTLRYIGAGGYTNRRFTLGASGGNALDASGSGAIRFTSDAPVTFAAANTGQTLTLTGTSKADNTLAARLVNNGTGATSLSKTGVGTWILTNSASTYTGATTITGGVLGVDKLADGGLASSLGASSAAASNLIIGNGATLRYTGTGDATNRLFSLASGVTYLESSGTGAIVFTDNGAVTLQSPNQDRTIVLGGTNMDDNTLAGSIGDAGGGRTILAKNDDGTWVLAGTNTYSGTTVINKGMLKIGDGGANGSIVSDVINGGTLGFNRADRYLYSGTISGAGGVVQMGAGVTVLTADHSYTGGTAITAGTLQLGDGGASGSVIGDVVNDGALAFNRSDVHTFGGVISGSGALTQIGTGTTILTSHNTYSGGTVITAGVLQVGDGGTSGGIIGDVINNSVFAINRSDSVTFDGMISGAGAFAQRGAGTTILTADNRYSGGTVIASGTLQLGAGGATGGLVGDVVNNGELIVNRSNSLTLDGLISGFGGLKHAGTGVTILAGANTYTGATDVNAGTLLVNGDQSGATGLTSVALGATLGGTGVLGGDVSLVDGAILTPGANGAGTLTINGNLNLSAGAVLNFEFGQADVVGGSLNDLINVGGDLLLDGQLNVAETAGGTFGAGIYRIFNYGRALTDNGLSLGATPSGSDLVVQTSVAGQVNLVNSAGLTLNFWDGAAGPKFDGVVNGGDGVWQASGGNNNWTGLNGAINAGYTDAAYAVFAGMGGVVSVDGGFGAVSASGLQIAAEGYVFTGDAITLMDAHSVIRVGDGSAFGAGYLARIESELAGASELVKTDIGTLVLAGANSYTGGTRIEGGVLSISSDINLGAAMGAVSFDGGTLRATADITTARRVALDGSGVIRVDPGARFTAGGVISGAGALTKAGDGVLTLTNANTYSGGTVITGGLLQIGDGGVSGGILGDVTNEGAFAINRSDVWTFDGMMTGSGSLAQIGAGATRLTGNNSYSGGTTISRGMLELGDGGTTGAIVGPVINNSLLAFNRADDVVFEGAISGAGQILQWGAGATILTGDSSGFTGHTALLQGALFVNASLGGRVTASTGATLGGAGVIGGDVIVSYGGVLNPGDQTSPGVLTIGGNLAFYSGAMLNYSFGQAGVAGGPLNDLIVAGGDLTLDGVINVDTTPGASFDPGLYRVINYAGGLTDNGLTIGVTPSPDFYVQTSIANQVNLVNTSGLQFRYWDGDGVKNDGVVDGGDGVWQRSTGNDNWVDDGSIPNAPFADAAFAVFMGAPGQVAVDDSLGAVEAAGMQFLTDGYILQGDAIHLVGPAGRAVIRTGDGSGAGAGITAAITSEIRGASQLVKSDLGTLILTGANSYTGGTAINGGVLRIASDANLGAATGELSFDGGTLNTTADMAAGRDVDLAGEGRFLVDGSTGLTLGGALSGAGGFIKDGAGDLFLTGAASYGGTTNVESGRLFVRGDQSAATGSTFVGGGALLGGDGVIGGDVALANGATLSAGVDGAGTLSIKGSLDLASGSMLDFQFGEANVAGGALNDLVTVGGDLTLDGTINVSTSFGGDFGPGVYRVFTYGGALKDNGLTLGVLPTGSDVAVQTSIGGQVNLVNSAGLTLNFWDGAAGPKNNSLVDGGDGVWRLGGGSSNWTDAHGAVNADYAQDSLVIFSAAPGRVTVDNSGGSVLTSGMQFAGDGYVIAGDALTLTGVQATIRVGDGAAAGASYTATIASDLIGGATLVKTDAGSLVLSGTNAYTGGTAIHGGELRISSDANLGAATGGLAFNGGALGVTADIAMDRAIDFVGSGSILTDGGSTLTLTGGLSGAGRLVKGGAGALVLAGSGGQLGGTEVHKGALLVNGDYSAARGLVHVASGASLGGVGVIGGDVVISDNGVLSPGAGGVGTLTINGDLSLSGGSRLTYQLGGAGLAGGVLNDLVNVGGDLVLDGVLDVTVPTGGAFDIGVYRLFNYGGSLTDNGLALGALPTSGEASVQTSILGQVNLVHSAGLTLNFWDGADGPKNNGVVNGGDGLWQSGAGNDNWTNAKGDVNAPFSDGAFAIFGGASGTVTIDDSLGDVTVGGLQFAADGYRIAGDDLTLSEPQTIVRVGDGGASGADFVATIDAVLGGSAELVKTDAGRLILNGANAYTGGTMIGGGVLQISNDANLGAEGGVVTLDGGVLATSADLSSERDLVMAGSGAISTAAGTTFDFGGLASGRGALTKRGEGTLFVTGDSSGFAGVTRVAEGVLALQGILGGGVGVAAGGRLEGSGRMASLANAGVVAPGLDGTFGALTIAGDYEGVGGLLELETELGGDGSRTDRLIIGGDAVGSTEVVVFNRGGLGAQTVEGVKIIEVGGASTGAFALRGDYDFHGKATVIAGAYGYQLVQGGVSTPNDGDWYLRSSLLEGPGLEAPEAPLYQPGAPLYETYSQTLQTLNGLPTLRQRVGDRVETSGVWARVESSRFRPESRLSTTQADLDLDSFRMQAGLDHALNDHAGGVLVAGMTFHYGEANGLVRSPFGDGGIDARGFGLGGTLTWYGVQGSYADAQVQISRLDGKLKSSVLRDVVDNNDGYGQAVSLELGKRLPFSNAVSVTPQIQVVYSKVSFDHFDDAYGARVSVDDGDSLKTRWGVSIDRQGEWNTASGAPGSALYGQVNLTYDWLDGMSTDVSGAHLINAHHRLWGEVTVGGRMNLSRTLTLYGEAGATTALRDIGDSYNLKAVAGIRMQF